MPPPRPLDQLRSVALRPSIFPMMVCSVEYTLSSILLTAANQIFCCVHDLFSFLRIMVSERRIPCSDIDSSVGVLVRKRRWVVAPRTAQRSIYSITTAYPQRPKKFLVSVYWPDGPNTAGRLGHCRGPERSGEPCVIAAVAGDDSFFWYTAAYRHGRARHGRRGTPQAVHIVSGSGGRVS